MAHTLIYRHLRPFAHAEPFPLKKKKKKVFKFHITLHILSAITDSFRVETEQEIQKKRNKDLGLEGFKGQSSSLSFLMCKSI